MALDKDAFLPAAFRKVQKIGKELKSNGTSNKAKFLIKKSIHETWLRLDEHLIIYILHTRADLYSLIFFLQKISDKKLHIRILNWTAYSCTDLPWHCFWITHAAFGVFRHNIGQNSFYLPFAKNMSHFAWMVEHADLQRRVTFLPVKVRPEKSYSHTQLLCFANIFDALVWVLPHFYIITIITLFQTTSLQAADRI